MTVFPHHTVELCKVKRVDVGLERVDFLYEKNRKII